MTTAIQIPELLKEEDFNCKESRATYCELINSTPHKLFTQKEYNNAVHNHVESPHTSNSSLHHASELYWDRDETGEKLKRPVLIMKRIDAEGSIDFSAPVVRYLPVEHSFDVLMNIHMSTYHGGLAEMINFVSDKIYTTNAIYLEFILLSCKECVQNGLSFEAESNPNKQIIVGRLGKKCFNRIVELDIHAFERPEYDGNFKFLLIYHDRDTWFTLLRPLLAKCCFEVATEMLKIITTFGFANNYAVKSKRILNFFLGFQEKLYTIGLKLESTKLVDSPTYQSTHVLKLFTDWIKTKNFLNWGIGCHIFQSEFNNTTPKTFSNQSRTPASLAFDGNIEPEKYKLHIQDFSSKDFDVGKTAFENVILQTDPIAIHQFSTTETAIREQLDQNTNREQLQREVPMPQLVIKEEVPIEPPYEEGEAGAMEYYFEICDIVEGEQND